MRFVWVAIGIVVVGILINWWVAFGLFGAAAVIGVVVGIKQSGKTGAQSSTLPRESSEKANASGKSDGYERRLPQKDAWEADAWAEFEYPIGLEAYLHYVDRKGQESYRTIHIDNFGITDDNDMMLHCYDYDRGANRMFRVSRIQEIYDLETGEMIEDSYTYLFDKYEATPLAHFYKALEQHKPEAKALVYVARADGRMTKKEKAKISEYLETSSGIEVDRDIANERLKELEVSNTEFNSLLKDLSTKSQDARDQLLATMDELVNSQKTPDPMETAAAEKARKKLRA